MGRSDTSRLAQEGGKKGDLFLFTSWRNILVNAQFGLLFERLVFKRAVNDIRAAIGIFQTGYQYRCE